MGYTSDFEWANDGAIRFFYTDTDSTYSAQLRMFHTKKQYYITERTKWAEQDQIYKLSDYLDALKHMPQEEIRKLSQGADGYSVLQLADGAPGDYERVLTYSASGLKDIDGWYIHLEVLPLHEVNGAYNGSGDEAIHLFYGANTSTTGSVEKWFDYLEKPDEMNWGGNLEIELPEYPDVTFRWYPEKMDAAMGSEVTQLYTGMPIWNTYFCDLTGDGRPDLCSTLSFGSGIIDSRIIVYDYANGTSYMLEDRGKYDYSLRLNETDGCLWVVKKGYNSDDIVASGKLLFADNCLQVAYDLKTNCESAPNTETSTSETENTLRTSDTVELIGYVGNSQTSWIELYESTDNKEPIATVPYDLIAALPGCDRKSEAFTFGYLDSITFYYGKIGAFCWCVAALPPAAGTGAANVCTSTDNGETWSISNPNALYTGTVIGAGFASEMVGFISYRYFFDNGPEIARTLDGGKTWARLELDIPEEYAQYNMQPQNPTFSGNDGSYPIILFNKDGNDHTMTLHTHDGGMTWIWPKLSAVDVS